MTWIINFINLAIQYDRAISLTLGLYFDILSSKTCLLTAVCDLISEFALRVITALTVCSALFERIIASKWILCFEDTFADWYFIHMWFLSFFLGGERG
ncbi:hypothetical protein BC937DRAFT_90932, partial [Endogone sp. FLAS-F59071]